MSWISHLLTRTVGAGAVALVTVIPGCNSEIDPGKQAAPSGKHQLVLEYEKPVGDGGKAKDAVTAESRKRYAIVGWESVEYTGANGNAVRYERPYVDSWISVRPPIIAGIHLGMGATVGAGGTLGLLCLARYLSRRKSKQAGG